jgi:transposase
LRKKLRRKEMIAFFQKLVPTVIAIEACGGSRQWARLLTSFGHEARRIASQLVKKSSAASEFVQHSRDSRHRPEANSVIGAIASIST